MEEAFFPAAWAVVAVLVAGDLTILLMWRKSFPAGNAGDLARRINSPSFPPWGEESQ